MRDLAIVFTFRRDALLFLCLEAIRADDPDIPIDVYADRGHSSMDLIDTCKLMNAHLAIRGNDKEVFGNSRNIILGIHESLVLFPGKPDIVHLIEDDTIINRGYFAYARNALASGRCAVALGRIPGDPPSTWYESPCVSWNREKLEFALQNVPPGYIEAPTRMDMLRIVDAAFP